MGTRAFWQGSVFVGLKSNMTKAMLGFFRNLHVGFFFKEFAHVSVQGTMEGAPVHPGSQHAVVAEPSHSAADLKASSLPLAPFVFI